MSSATTATTRSATPRTVPPPRHLASYLALPRPGDTVKWLILPLGFAVGSVREWPGTDAALRAVVVWLALELLIYQARYQWNDIRGFEADQRHPDGDRGRLPGPLSRRTSRVAWSAGTAVAKVVAAVALCGLLDLRTGWVVAGLVVAVFALASVYEALRATSTGRTGQVPAPLAPGVVAIWVVIGAGYALRAVTGMGLAVDLGTPDALLPLAVVACWAFGISWITSRWAIEATAFASRAADGGLRWSATAEQAREHQLALVRWLPDGVPASVRELRHWRAVQQSARWSAPWNLTGVVAGAAAAACGVVLADPARGAGPVLVGAAAGAAATALVLAAGGRRPIAVLVGATAVAVALLAAGVDEPLRASAAWVVVAVSQTCYLRQDAASMGRLLRRRAP